MIFSEVLERFVDQSPFCVLARGLLENVFAPEKLDALFAQHTDKQRQRQLLFSTCVDVMAEVVCRIRPSVNAAHRHRRQRDAMPVGVDCLYEKLQGVETQTSRALVRHTATEVALVLDELQAKPLQVLFGYDLRIIDGNHPNGTEHRLDVLRDEPAAALPGVVVAVLDPQKRLIQDVVLSTDGHAQECTLVEPLVAAALPGQLWLADRHYCTSAILFGLARRKAFFLFRQHGAHLRWRLEGERHCKGRTATGEVYEQKAILTDPKTGEEMAVRRITVVLDKPTRDKDTEIHLLSNVPEQDDEAGHKGVTALQLADAYRDRWLLETAFHDLTVHLCCEPNTLGYPEAALFAFCVAVCCYNLLAAMHGAVRVVHGEEEEAKMSSYYTSDEIKGTYRGMDIAVPEEQWAVFRTADSRGLARLLEQIVARMKVPHYCKSTRGPKKPKEHKSAPRQHIATDRLLHPERYPPKKKKKPAKQSAAG
jgi:hypothetical protein